MLVYLQKEGKTLEVRHNGTAADLLAGLGVNPEVVLIVKDGQLVTEKDDISDAERIELLSVISGG
jgi:sulfur carrier protein ThiS